MNMKRIIGFILLCLILIPVLSYGADNTPNVALIMQQILGEVKNINKAFGNRDYYTTATHFMELAKLFKSLEDVFSEKSKKVIWDRIHNEIIKESFIAIGACAREDDDGITQSLNNIGALQSEGHKLFR